MYWIVFTWQSLALKLLMAWGEKEIDIRLGMDWCELQLLGSTGWAECETCGGGSVDCCGRADGSGDGGGLGAEDLEDDCLAGNVCFIFFVHGEKPCMDAHIGILVTISSNVSSVESLLLSLALERRVEALALFLNLAIAVSLCV